MTNYPNKCSFLPLKLEITDVSFQRLLQQFLGTQLNDFVSGEIRDLAFRPGMIPLSRSSSLNPVVYRSAIAFWLARQFSMTPLMLAEKIFDLIKAQQQTISNQSSDMKQLSGDIILRLGKTGWLTFEVSDRLLAIWLQRLMNWPLSIPALFQRSSNDDNLFPLEYAYARCCALLRLGDQAGIIRLNNRNFEQNLGQWLYPDPVSWYDWKLEQLKVSSLVERTLISQFIIISDRVIKEPTIQAIPLANHLRDAFLNFERYCRIFGEIAEKKRELSQLRLGLVAITRSLLQQLWLSQYQQLPRHQL